MKQLNKKRLRQVLLSFALITGALSSYADEHDDEPKISNLRRMQTDPNIGLQSQSTTSLKKGRYATDYYATPPEYAPFHKTWIYTPYATRTQFALVKDRDRSSGIVRFVRDVCMNPLTIKPIFDEVNEILGSPSVTNMNEKELLSNCMMSATIAKVIHYNAFHFGFINYQIDKAIVREAFKTSDQIAELKRATKKIARAYSKYGKRYSGLDLTIYDSIEKKKKRKMWKTKSYGRLVVNQTMLVTKDWRTGDPDRVTLFSGYSTGYVGSVENLFNFTELKARIFAYFWTEFQKPEYKVAFAEQNNIEYIQPIIIQLGRPEYGSSHARSSAGGPYFHLDYTNGFNRKGQKIFSGYAQRFGHFENKSKPSKTKAQWAVYDIGMNRERYYPNHLSLFLSYNKNPFAGYKREQDFTKGNWRAVTANDHSFLLVRSGGRDYITFEGIPCTFIIEDSGKRNRNLLNCSLPVTASRVPTLKDVEQLLKERLHFMRFMGSEEGVEIRKKQIESSKKIREKIEQVERVEPIRL